MPIKIHHSVIHGFFKESRQPVANVVKKNVLLDCSLEGVISLVAGMSTLLGRRENNQVWGHFGTESREGLFPDAFAAYADNVLDAAGFLALTHIVVDEVTKCAATEPLSTGGHILCAVYDNEAGETIAIVAMIKQKGGVSLDENYVPIGIVEVDMSKLHQAAQIRIADFLRDANLQQGADEDELDRNYLSFLSPRANRDSSGYFVTALGCVVGLSASKATAKVYEAVDAYFRNKAEIAPFRKLAKEKLTEYLQWQLGLDEPATLDGLREALERVVPHDKAAYVKDISEYLNGEQFKVPDNFQVSSTVVKRNSKVVLDSDRISVKFDPAILGTDANAPLHYDKANKTLTIRNLSDEFVRRLDSTLSGN